MSEGNDIISVRELMEYCADTDDDCDVFVNINNIPIGFGVVEIDYDWDGAIKLQIRDENLQYLEEK